MSDKKLPPTVPSMVGKNVYLRPATPEDLANTHHWWLQSEPQTLISSSADLVGAATISEAYKKKTAEKQSTDLLMIVRRKDNTPVGRVWFDHVNQHNRSAHVSVLIDPDERRHGHGRDGLNLLCKYLFLQRGFNRVWTIVSESNHDAVGFIHSAGFEQDGQLRQYFFYEGNYHNGLLYSLLRYQQAV